MHNCPKARRQRGVEQDYLHVATDDATRLGCAAPLPAQDLQSCGRLLGRALQRLSQLGIPVTGVMTDTANA